MSGGNVMLGIDNLLKDLAPLHGKAIGIIANPTAVDKNFRHIVDILHDKEELQLAAIFGPEHGFRGDENGSVENSVDPHTNLVVYSLYGETQKPTTEMLREIDLLLFDIQDAGARFYTYISTMAYSMEAAAEKGLEFVVLDRPNPINGTSVEGPILEESFQSFVGPYPLPIRHGMTIGELALYFNNEFGIGADLSVIPMVNWSREQWYDDTGLGNWIQPSPNLPTLATATVYPGTCLLEGTNISEGRGTTRPFEVIGAPFINAMELARFLTQRELPGAVFRPISFIPLWQKYEGQRVYGVQIHVVHRDAFQPVRTGVEILTAIQTLYPGQLDFKQETFDRLAGTSQLREAILNGESVDFIVNSWQSAIQSFKVKRQKYLLY